MGSCDYYEHEQLYDHYHDWNNPGIEEISTEKDVTPETPAPSRDNTDEIRGESSVATTTPSSTPSFFFP
eukprot:9725953-Heterocapsa_arctica.AAC.1